MRTCVADIAPHRAHDYQMQLLLDTCVMLNTLRLIMSNPRYINKHRGLQDARPARMKVPLREKTKRDYRISPNAKERRRRGKQMVTEEAILMFEGREEAERSADAPKMPRKTRRRNRPWRDMKTSWRVLVLSYQKISKPSKPTHRFLFPNAFAPLL